MGMDSIILTGLVSLSCGSIKDADSVKNACFTGTEAAARQSGVYENIKKEENSLREKIEVRVKENISENALKIMSTTVLSGRLLLGQKSSFVLGKGPLKGNYIIETDSKDIYLKIGWEL
jgi:hypothetical protein